MNILSSIFCFPSRHKTTIDLERIEVLNLQLHSGTLMYLLYAYAYFYFDFYVFFN